jgi:hypothetical protein
LHARRPQTQPGPISTVNIGYSASANLIRLFSSRKRCTHPSGKPGRSSAYDPFRRESRARLRSPGSSPRREARHSIREPRIKSYIAIKVNMTSVTHARDEAPPAAPHSEERRRACAEPHRCGGDGVRSALQRWRPMALLHASRVYRGGLRRRRHGSISGWPTHLPGTGPLLTSPTRVAYPGFWLTTVPLVAAYLHVEIWAVKRRRWLSPRHPLATLLLPTSRPWSGVS